jgi:hypothetical protein
MHDDLSISVGLEEAARSLNSGAPAALNRTQLRVVRTEEDGDECNQTLARREFEGLTIDVVPADKPWEQHNEVALYIEGERCLAQPATIKFLFRLLEQPTCVYTFAQLCSALCLKSHDQRRNKDTLIEHARRCRILLKDAKLPLYVAVVPTVGYALCRKARNTGA